MIVRAARAKERIGSEFNGTSTTTNLMKEYLLEYTEAFTKQYVATKQRRRFRVEQVHFNYQTETWESRGFVLPKFEDDFVLLLTPKNLLTKEDTWINRHDLASDVNHHTADIQLWIVMVGLCRPAFVRHLRIKEEFSRLVCTHFLLR